jgi:chromosome segregation ATPase
VFDQLEEEQESLKTIIAENEEQEKMIEKLQNTIFEKIEQGERRIEEKEEELKDLPQRFKQLIKHKKDIQDVLKVIEHEETELKEEIKDIRKAATSLRLSLGAKEFDKELQQLDNKIDMIIEKRSFFKDKVNKLIKLLDWKKN